jgi:hypothetical protein
MKPINSILADPVIRGAIICIGIILVLCGGAIVPIICIQIMAVFIPFFFFFLAFRVMHQQSEFSKAFLYASGVLLFWCFLELFILFLFFTLTGNPTRFSNLVSPFKDLEFPLVIFGLATATTSSIEASVSSQKDLSIIKQRLTIRDNPDE